MASSLSLPPWMRSVNGDMKSRLLSSSEQSSSNASDDDVVVVDDFDSPRVENNFQQRGQRLGHESYIADIADNYRLNDDVVDVDDFDSPRVENNFQQRGQLLGHESYIADIADNYRLNDDVVVVDDFDSPRVENNFQQRGQLLGHESYIADIADNYRLNDDVVVVDDFDSPRVENNFQQRGQLLGHESYIADIADNYRLTENFQRPKEDYLAGQPELDEDMRWEVADWLIRTHSSLRLTPEALYLSFNILDRYLSLQDVAAAQLHLVGVCALFIAAKYQGEWLGVDKICSYSDDKSLTNKMISEKEKDILRKLQWKLTLPTPYVFMTMFLHAGTCGADEELQSASLFFGELGLMDYSAVARPPSLQAAAALYAARCMLGTEPRWPEQLAQETKYTEPQLLDSARSLMRLRANSEIKKPVAVYEKYSTEDWERVALPQPASATTTSPEKKAKTKRSLLHRALRRCNKRIRSFRHNMPKVSCFKP